jgi:hypothetical protein
MSTTARHANFASVISVTADFVDGMLAATASLTPLPAFNLPNLIQVGADSVGLAGSLTLLVPTVSFASNPNNLIGVSCGASGVLRLSANSADLIEVKLTLTADLNVALVVDVSAAALAIAPDLSHASVTGIDVQVEFGPPLTPVYQSAIQDPAVLDAFSAALQAIPQKLITFTIPGATGTFDVKIGPLNVPLPFSRILAVPLDGDVLNIAADVSPYTAGDPTQLVNLITAPSPTPMSFVIDQWGNETGPTGGVFKAHSGYGISIAAVVNVAFLNAVMNGPVSSQLSAVDIQGVTLNSLSVSAGQVKSVIGESNLPGPSWYNCVSMSGSGSYGGVGFNLNAAVTPVTTYRPSNVDVSLVVVSYSYSSLALSMIEGLVGVLTLGLGTLIINSTVASIVNNATSQAASLPLPASSGLQPIPGIAGWTVSYSVQGMVVWEPDVGAAEIDLFAAAAVNGPPAAPMPLPVFRLSAAAHALKDLSPIQISMTVSDAGLFDPLLGLRISWTALRQDTGQTVLTKDLPLTTAALTVSLDRATGDLIYNDTWSVSCEVYRPADGLIPRYSYIRQSVDAGVTDVVDRHYPYVRWDHQAFFHDPDGPPPLKSHRLWSRSRHSRIHRTDLLTRCEVVNGSLSPQAPAVRLGMSPVYLYTLTPYGAFADVAGVPRSESWRDGVLCDYCFFGGPTRTVWKPPTPPTPDWV